MKKPSPIPNAVAFELTSFFLRNGYVRRHNPVRYAADGCMKYKKGDEIRLVANSISERVHILRLVETMGFKAGQPHQKSKTSGQYRIPIYGREQVARFLQIIEETKQCQPVKWAYFEQPFPPVEAQPKKAPFKRSLKKKWEKSLSTNFH